MNEIFKYNPFSGILNEDIEEIVVPIFNSEQLISKIQNSEPLAIEFLGKEGRGKTTHLTYLQKQMKEYPIFLLNQNTSLTEITNNKSKVVFIDSIHHLNWYERIKLFKAKKTIIYTTHSTRKLDCFLAKKTNYSIKFRGITKETLHTIINKRLKLAANENSEYKIMAIDEIEQLIKKFGDNYRGIINHLYEKHQ